MRFLVVLAAAFGCASSAKENACQDVSDCTGSAVPYCVNNVCVACDGPTACTTDQPRCAPETATCVACIGDLDCAAYPTQSRCAPDGSCVGCLDNTQCANPAPVCDNTDLACRGCEADDECATRVCDTDTGTCVAGNTILYAAPGAADTTPCSVTSPCSLTRALQYVDTTKNTVRMLPGQYGATILISGASKVVTIVGTGATLVGVSGMQPLRVDTNATVTVRGLTIAPVAGSTPPAVSCTAATLTSALKLRELTVHPATLANTTIQTAACNLVLDRVSVPDTANGALTAGANSITRIDRSSFGDTIYLGGSGISLQATNTVFFQPVNLSNLTGSTNVHVSFSTFYGTTESCAPSQLMPTILFDNDIVHAAAGDPDSIIGTHCTFDHVLAFPQATTLGSSTLVVDPKFTDGPGGNLHLLTGSPAIDAADPAVMATPDYDGVARPQGARADRGAFEYKP